MKTNDKITITLDAYQAANLKAVIEAIGYPYYGHEDKRGAKRRMKIGYIIDDWDGVINEYSKTGN